MVEPFYWLNINNKRVWNFVKRYLLNGERKLNQAAQAHSEDMARK